MKKIKYIIIFAFLAAAVSCEDLRFGNAMLEKPTSNTTSIDSVFSCKTYAMRALTKAYTSLPVMLYGYLHDRDWTESFTDINNSTLKLGAMQTVHYPGTMTSSTSTQYMRYDFIKGAWPGIRDAYIFLENVNRVPEDGSDPMTPEEKVRASAEAYAIIALHYVDMFRHFGGVPKVDHAITSEELMDPELKAPRMTVEETVNYILDLLDNQVIPHLPWFVPDEENGRMTSAFGVALKIRLLHFAASPLFNSEQPYMQGEAADKKLVWWGNYDKSRWQDVLDACKQFEDMNAANGNYYKLVSTGNPRKDFQKAYYTRSNHEVILSIRDRNTYQGSTWIFSYTKNGTGNVTLDYVDMFPMLDGTQFDWNNPEHAANPFFNGKKEVRDPRLYETVAINGDSWQGRKVESYIGGDERPIPDRVSEAFSSGFLIRKFRLDAPFKAKGPSFKNKYSYPYIRLADLILIKAEALNEMASDALDAPAPAEAYDEIKKIRDRVKMPNIKAGLTREQFRDAVLTERALELGFEDSRFFDLVRCKRKDIFTKKLRGLDIISTDKGKTLKFEQFEIPNIRYWQQNWDDSFYLTPIPKREILKNYGLVQNPGW